MAYVRMSSAACQNVLTLIWVRPASCRAGIFRLRLIPFVVTPTLRTPFNELSARTISGRSFRTSGCRVKQTAWASDAMESNENPQTSTLLTIPSGARATRQNNSYTQIKTWTSPEITIRYRDVVDTSACRFVNDTYLAPS